MQASGSHRGWGYEAHSASDDVSGDGKPDRVSLVVAKNGRPDCRVFVAVRSNSTVHSVALAGADPDFDPGLGIVAFARINTAEGAEIIVRAAAGADVEFFAVITDAGRILKQVPAPAEPRPLGAAGLFASGGGVEHFQNFDCAGKGKLAILSAIRRPRGMDSNYTRATYTIESATLDRSGVVHKKIDPMSLMDPRLGIEQSAFSHCPLA